MFLDKDHQEILKIDQKVIVKLYSNTRKNTLIKSSGPVTSLVLEQPDRYSQGGVAAFR